MLNSRKRGSALIASILLVASCVLLGLSSGDPSMIRRFGLIEVLPLSFYLAFGLLALSCVVALKGMTQKDKILRVLLVYLVLSTIFLAIIPVFTEGTPRFRTSYKNYGFAEEVLTTNHITPKRFWYHNWPGFSYFFASLMRISDLPDPHGIMIWFSSVSVLGVILAMAILTRRRMLTPYAIAIPIILFIFTNWVGQDYTSPQAMAMFLFILFIAFFVGKGEESKVTQIFFVLSFIALTMTHALTSMVVLGVLLIFFLRNRSTTIGAMLLFGGVVFLLWNAFGARPYAEKHFVRMLGDVLRLEIVFGATTSRLTGNWSHRMVVTLRMIFSFLIFILMTIGLLMSRRHWDRKWEGALLATIIGIGLVSPFLVYGGELMMRVYFLSLPLACIFAAKVFGGRYGAHLLIAFLVIAVPFDLVARYGNEEHDYIRPSEFEVAYFMYDNVPKGYFFGGAPWSAYRPGRFFMRSLLVSDPENYPELPVARNTYALVGYDARMRAKLWGEDLDGALKWIENNQFDRLYANGGNDLYLYPIKK